jgi:hypothetical protein
MKYLTQDLLNDLLLQDIKKKERQEKRKKQNPINRIKIFFEFLTGIHSTKDKDRNY